MKLVELTQPKEQAINQAIDWHLSSGTPLLDCVFRYGSDNWFAFFHIIRQKEKRGDFSLMNQQDKDVIHNSELGTFGEYEGKTVPLDHIFESEAEEGELSEAEYKGKKVELNKPRRGGSGGKKFHVFVKNPKTGNVKKISFGDSTGLSVKIQDPKAKKSFVARHDCEHKTDKMTAGYWACRIPRYSKSLGLAKSSGYW